MADILNQWRNFQDICAKYNETDKLLFEEAEKLALNIAKSYSTLNIDFNNNHYYIHNKGLYQNGGHVCRSRLNILMFAKDIENGLLEKLRC